MALFVGEGATAVAQPPPPAVADGAADRRSLARVALRLADQLLDRLELLNLKGRRDVPARLSALVSALDSAAQRAGVKRLGLDSDSGVLRLMDDVYDAEDQLLPRCRVRPYPPAKQH